MIASELAVKWALAVHFSSCYTLTCVFMSLGIRMRRLQATKVKVALVACVMFVLTQFPITMLRFSAINRGALPVEPVEDVLINLMWSPMLTCVLIWLYVTHAVRSCYSCAISLPRKNVKTIPDMTMLGKYVLSGILTTFILHSTGLLESRNHDDIVRLLAAVGMLGSSLEIIYIRAKYNAIRITSASWAWLVGTFLGAISLTIF